MRLILSAVLLCIAVALIANRALAPLYGRFDTSECRAAYAKARTQRDSVRVDLHPAVAPAREKKYCGALRARHVGSVADLAVLAPANLKP